MNTLIETKTMEGVYGLAKTLYIIDTAKHGRLLCIEGFGGNDIEGQCYRLKHGEVFSVDSDATISKLQKSPCLWHDGFEWRKTDVLAGLAYDAYDEDLISSSGIKNLGWDGFLIQKICEKLKGVKK